VVCNVEELVHSDLLELGNNRFRKREDAGKRSDADTNRMPGGVGFASTAFYKNVKFYIY
jgi:hypothetical protein